MVALKIICVPIIPSPNDLSELLSKPQNSPCGSQTKTEEFSASAKRVHFLEPAAILLVDSALLPHSGFASIFRLRLILEFGPHASAN